MSKKIERPKMYMYKRIVEAKLYIDTNYNEKIDLEKIAHQAHFSKYHFLRLFKNAFGKSPNQYLTEVRIHHAKQFLGTNFSVTKTCFKVGFESIPSFINLFKREVGLTPSEYLNAIIHLEQIKQMTPLSLVPNCFAANFGKDK